MSKEELGGKIWKFRRLCLPVTLVSSPIWTFPNRMQCHLHWALWKLNTLFFSEWLRHQVSQNPPAAQTMSPKDDCTKILGIHRSLSWPMALLTIEALLSTQLECASPGRRDGQSGKNQWLQCVSFTFASFTSQYIHEGPCLQIFINPGFSMNSFFLGYLCPILIISYLSFKSQPPLLGW